MIIFQKKKNNIFNLFEIFFEIFFSPFRRNKKGNELLRRKSVRGLYGREVMLRERELNQVISKKSLQTGREHRVLKVITLQNIFLVGNPALLATNKLPGNIP